MRHLKTARDAWRLFRAIPAIWLYHFSSRRGDIEADVSRWVQCLQRLERSSLPVAQNIAWLLAAFPEFRNLFNYRLGSTSQLLKPFYKPMETLQINTPHIGPGLFIQHGFATIIVAKSIESNVWINQQVTLGHIYDRGAPTIGGGVTIGAGAVVVGPVRVGAGATVGANTTVVRDVPPQAVVVSQPARIIQKDPTVSKEQGPLG